MLEAKLAEAELTEGGDTLRVTQLKAALRDVGWNENKKSKFEQFNSINFEPRQTRRHTAELEATGP